MSDRYEIREKLGQGGLGAVYKAYDKQLKREVALKRVITPTQEAVDDLLREATALSSLMHPNIVTVFDVGQDAEGGFVVMELLDGETLDDTISRAPLTLPDFAEVVNQTLEALIAAQAVNMVHRDLKPSNIMVIWRPSGRFQIKVLDFGLAKISAAPTPQTSDQEEGILGSIYFMAPEQFERTTLDFRTDMYAMGCIYYYCLTAQYPFDGETAPQVMMAHLHHLVRPLEVVRPDLPEEVADWVMWLMERNREDRANTAREALDRFPDLTRPTPVISGAIAQDGTVRASPAPSLDEIVARAATADVPASPRAGATTHALRPVGPRPPGSHRGGALRGGGGSKSARRDVTGAVAVVADDEDGEVVELKAASNRTKLIFIIASSVSVLALLLVGMSVYNGKVREQKEAERVKVLSASPQGDGSDVSLLLRRIGNDAKAKDSSPAQILEKLQGKGVEDALRKELETVGAGAARMALLDAVASRLLGGTVPALLKIYQESGSPDERKKALHALSKIAGPDDVGAFLALLKVPNMEASERKQLEDSICSILYRNDRLIARAQSIYIDELPKSKDDHRKSLVRIVGKLGGGEQVLNRFLVKTLSAEEQILALSEWPDRSCKDILESFMTGVGKTSRTAAARAYMRMLLLPTAQTDDTNGYKLVLDAADRKELDPFFQALVANPTAQTLKFCQENKITELDVPFAEASGKIRQAMKDVYVIKPGQTVPASKAQIFGGSDGTRYDKDKQADQIDWKSPQSWMSWVVKMEAPGTYEVGIVGSCPNNEGSSVKITFVGEPLQWMTAKTPSGKTSEVITMGTIKIDPPQQDVRRLFLSAGEVAQPGGIMKVKGIRFTKK